MRGLSARAAQEGWGRPRAEAPAALRSAARIAERRRHHPRGHLGLGGGGAAALLCDRADAALAPAAGSFHRRLLCRGDPRHLGAGAALLSLLHPSRGGHPHRSLLDRGAGHRRQYLGLWRRDRAGGDPRYRSRTMGGGHGAGYAAALGAAPDHPAPGAAGDAALLRQSDGRSVEADLAGLADHPHRPHLRRHGADHHHGPAGAGLGAGPRPLFPHGHAHRLGWPGGWRPRWRHASAGGAEP